MKEMMDTLKAIDDHKETEAEKKVIPEEINKKPVNEKEDNFFESLPNLLEKFRLFMSPSDYNDFNQLFTRDDSPLNLEGRKRLDRDFNAFMQFIDSMLKGKPISEMEMANVCTIINNLPPLFIQLDQWAKKYERQKKEKLELKEL
ncbi:unnamed protein product [Medioppia subpectinata]|uniref:Uncharacterized protein n=1 Tax=Medioppia subpectinata TaxID=1979941 RepID=A0A7R9LP94_9ACAR|nr:unnamed protein product [Medioppia subpectinata]CAG2120195.1 unnamed protein product [Medioppia subpectinata]